MCMLIGISTVAPVVPVLQKDVGLKGQFPLFHHFDFNCLPPIEVGINPGILLDLSI